VSLLDLAPTLVELADGAGSGGMDADDGVTDGGGTHGGDPTEAAAASAAGLGDAASEEAVAAGRTGLSLLESMRRETSGVAGPQDRDVVIEYLAEGTYRPQITVVRGQLKFVLCPGDPDQLYDLEADPDELANVAEDPAYAQIAAQLRQEVTDQYDLGELEAEVLGSQERRRLVAGALQTGSQRHWDFDPDPEQRYVRGDFWDALSYGRIPGQHG
jgi:choline-sulfatase